MKELDTYIAIEGPIGVGKTSLAERIADKLNARKVFEQFEENPFLKDFYDDPESNAFQTQVFFLLQRYQQQQKDIRQLNLLKKALLQIICSKKTDCLLTLLLILKQSSNYIHM